MSRMTFTDMRKKDPRSFHLKKETDKVNLVVHGQGILLFEASEPCSLVFCDVSGTPGMKVDFTETNIRVHLLPSNEPLIDPKNTKGLVKEIGAYYWFSLDSQNQRLFAGIGEARKETSTYMYQATKETKQLFESLTYITLDKLRVTRLLRDPITRNVPLLVKHTEELTLDVLAQGEILPKANLSIIAQKLYDCISGKQFVLDSPDFPEFSNAIEHSINTPGKWCHERLKQKSTEFDKDKPDEKETYLRITLGENNGESPGIPYVMEIWPVGHYSPIHNHGGSSAIIRVLHGSIHVSLFPFLSGDELEPFAKKEFQKGDITWISPTLNQIHQLKNTASQTCITIQCYMYNHGNTGHYDYFDYLDGEGKTQQYEPDSDMEFLAFKALMKKEWMEQAPQKKVRKSWFCGV